MELRRSLPGLFCALVSLAAQAAVTVHNLRCEYRTKPPGIDMPQPGADLRWVRASYDSVRGRIASEWRKAGGRFALDVTIPANTTALVHVPAADASRVTESGRPAITAPGVKFVRMVRMERDAAVFAVGSGRYAFVAE